MEQLLSEKLEKLRDKTFDLRREITEDLRIDYIEGCFTTIISALYGEIERQKGIEFENLKDKEDKVVKFVSRGIGMEPMKGCYICGGKRKDEDGEEMACMSNISGFIRRKEDAEILNELFPDFGYFDFRGYEPNYLQYKIGACHLHKENLEKLNKSISRHNAITEGMVLESKKNNKINLI